MTIEELLVKEGRWPTAQGPGRIGPNACAVFSWKVPGVCWGTGYVNKSSNRDDLTVTCTDDEKGVCV